MSVTCPKCRSENADSVKFCGECGTPLPSAGPEPRDAFLAETLQMSAPDLATGASFAGRYQIIEELGRGGMGRVYKAFDTKIKEKVALKLIKPEVAADRDTLERFSSEIRLARRIGHRNVCRMFDLGEAEGVHFITMEYVPGEDLKSMIRMSGTLSMGMILSVGRQVCDGLAEAHALGVVHRDLKPQNIMIDRGGSAKIMDFGIARSIREKGITGPSVMIGTPEYMSPEQAEAKDVDARSDIYSLGVVLYEMATSRVPFDGETALAVAMKHKSETPKDPRELNPGLRADLAAAILKCLEKDKGRRYQSAAELRSELERIEKTLPTADRVVPLAKPATSRAITVKLDLRRVVLPGLALLAVMAAAFLLWRGLPRKAAAPPTAGSPSIAVLPFVDDSPEKGHDYLCEGLPNTLINVLGTVPNLRVPARTSAFALAGQEKDIQTIGRRLNVENVLEGSVQVVGSALRVTARLIKVKDGYRLWNATYDRQMKDIFAIQDEIAQAIVKALRIELLGGRQDRLVKRGTDDPDAYKLYLEGLFYWNRRTEKNLNQAIDLFDQAVRKDPGYALAYAGLADSYSLISMYGVLPPTEAFPRAKEAALKALELDPDLAEAHNSLGYVRVRYDWDWPAAEKEYRRALALNPNYATGHFWYGELLVSLGRFDEGIAELRRAVELDPVSLVINENLGWAYLMARRYDEAWAQLRKTLDMDPSFAATHLMLGYIHINRGRGDEAIAEMTKACELSGSAPTVVAALAYAYAAAGKVGEAKAVIDGMPSTPLARYISPYRLADVYAAMGDRDKTFELLNKAYQARDEWMTTLKIDPSFDALRSDPRYQALLAKMRLQ